MLRNRWGVLAVLFAVRLGMGFQFQSIAAVAPLLGPQFGVGIADIGLLVGLYFTPGVALSLAGGAIGQRFGDKFTVLVALVLMMAGSLIMALTDSWGAQIAGRLIGGAGGVLLNVQMSKMVADWFAGREIATAMAIFVNSWPAGVALSLLILPPIGIGYGVKAVYLVVVASIATGFLLLATAYRSPDQKTTNTVASARLDRRTIVAVIVAGLMWGFYNVGFAMILSFGPSLLVEHAWSIAAAGSMISIVMWAGMLSTPSGGFLADRIGRPQTVLITGCVLFASMMIAFPRSTALVPTVVVLGLVSGLAAGPMLSLPARVLAPATRAIGMGIFFSTYYGAMMLGPVIGGACAKWTGSAGAAFDFGAVSVLACPLMLVGFNLISRRLDPHGRIDTPAR